MYAYHKVNMLYYVFYEVITYHLLSYGQTIELHSFVVEFSGISYRLIKATHTQTEGNTNL